MSTSGGQTSLQRKLAQPDRREWSDLGGLKHDGVPGRQRRSEAPAGDGHREVPRDDDTDDAQRLLERDVDPACHGDLLAEVPLGRGGVVVENVADVACLTASVADGVARIE